MTAPFRFQIGHLKIIDHLILAVAGHSIEKEKNQSDTFLMDTVACASWGQVCEKLVNGEINGAFLTLPEALNLFSKGLDIRLLMFTHRGGSLVLTGKTSKIKNVPDFKGKSVLVPSRLSVQHLLIHRMITSAGINMRASDIDASQVTAEAVAPCLMPEILEQDADGDIAGFVVQEPFGTMAVRAGFAKRLCRTGDLWKNHPCSVFVLHQNVIDSVPEIVSRLLSFFRQAGQFLELENPESFDPIAGQFLDLPAGEAAQILADSDICFSPALLVPESGIVQTIQDYMSDAMGILEKKVDLNQFINPDDITERELDHTLED